MRSEQNSLYYSIAQPTHQESVKSEKAISIKSVTRSENKTTLRSQQNETPKRGELDDFVLTYDDNFIDQRLSQSISERPISEKLSQKENVE